uniref:RING-type domain-containing protein n=1 Tax=Triticum aestivum TaxID=4565 RepID=A0A3B6EMJ3_WHEAT
MPMQMDVDGQPTEALEEMDNLENYTSENEICGICRDIVIDRGVLDGCQHWFCYTCIDNWSAITNRCPLCKIEFQNITSTPVYDSTGTGDTIEDDYPLTSGDDDWYDPGESNTLSFPSYYIDAEAVVCLDGGDCIIRSGLVAAEDNSALDTSIACDSCDLWYHAICVGFNPETTSEDSWLCPRCVSIEAKNESEVVLKQNVNGDSDRTSTDASFSGRVSVSVADDGETALVVSMVGVNSESKDDLLEGSLGSETAQEAFYCNSHPSYSIDDLSHEAVANACIPRNKDISCSSHNKSSETNLARTVSSEPTQRSSELSAMRESACILFSAEHGNILNEQSEVPQDGLSYSLLCRSKEAESTGEDAALPRNSNGKSPVIKSAQLSSAASKVARSADVDMINSDAVQKRKNDQNTQLPPMEDRQNASDMESGDEISHPAKKAKLGVPDQEMYLIANSGVSSSDCHATSIAAEVIASDTSKIATQNKYVPDIMSIVEGESYMRDPGRELAKPVVQKLQQEIREVVRDNGISILKKDNAFDEKLLTAFRSAIGKSMDGPAKKPNLSLARKSLLQKGKIRENLTKKLYASSTGRRRSAWHRDREVDFWKHRCSPGINPEKIETLQSVLQLLKKSSGTGTRKESAEEKKAFLSRLYLADASVVPRKGDIKPLSALEGSLPFDKNSQIKGDDGKSTNKPAPVTQTIKINSPNSTGKVSSSSTLSKEALSRRENKNGQAPQNKQNQSAGDIKQDKRKWALEILARKNASSIGSKDQTEGTDDLSRNYPLLAKLPVDMRPQLTTGRHNKVPMSVRQAQLYRIAEYYLQRANLDVIRRCADTELAIADAVNVENDIYGKSSSKSVYVNLCSQATRQSAKPKPENDASTLTEKAEVSSDLISQQVTTENTNSGSSNVEEALDRAGLLDIPATAGQTDKSELAGVLEQNASENTVCFNSVEEVLKRAGLFDSPPNSPERKSTTAEGNSRTVSGSPISTQQKYTNTDDTYLVNLDSEPSRSLQSSSDSRVRDASPLKDEDDSSVQVLDDANCQNLDQRPSYQQPKCNSEDDQKLIPSGETTDVTANETLSVNLAEVDKCSLQCEKTSQTDKETVADIPDEVTGHVENSKEVDITVSDLHNKSSHGNNVPKEGEGIRQAVKLEPGKEKSSSGNQELNRKHSKADKSSTHPAESVDSLKKPAPDPGNNSASDSSSSVHKKVEMFVKENIRPLCKSGVITVEQYRWAVAKTAEKVMKHHSEAKNANFLIKEGDKVKKLALQYVEAAQQKIS